MPQLKNMFTQGRMNKDLDERLIPKGQYRDATNIQVSTSEGSDVGAIETILGNTKINNKPGGGTWNNSFGLSSPTCIGVVRDTENNRIYWFITSSASNVDAILEYDEATGIVSPVLVDARTSAPVLNFSANSLITGVNVLEDLLLWTDNLNEPRSINIATFKAGSTQPGSTLNTTTQVYGRDFVEFDISVLKESPKEVLTVTTAPSIYGGPGTGITPITDAGTSGVDWNTLETGDSVGISWTGAITWTGLTNPKVVLSTEVEEDNGVVNKYQVTGTLSSIATLSASLTIDSITPNIPTSVTDMEMLLVEDEPIFKRDFPRFSYRYKYADGEYSTYAPFTKAAFVPGKFEYSGRNGFNEGMTDVIRKITLSNFPTTPVNVDEVQVVYKSAVSNNIYLIESFNYDFSGVYPVLNLEITSDTLGPVIESSQLLRLWDNVPIKAKAQEIIGNRLIYGNYTQNYDITNGDIVMQVDQTNTTHTNVGYGEESIKTDRKYQIGISFLDEMGRESPVFTSPQGSISLQKENSDKENTIQARLASSANIPSWADKFKLYIKNNNAEYYNLGLDRYYDAIDGNVWLSFSSAERNKVQEGNYIILKKGHDSNSPIQENNRYKVLAISNEAPKHLANVKTAIAAADLKSELLTSYPIEVGNNRVKFWGPNSDTLTSDPAPLRGADANFSRNIRQGNYIQFSSQSGSGRSFTYKIIAGGPTGVVKDLNSGSPVENWTQYEIELQENIKENDVWLQNLADASVYQSFRGTVFINEDRNLPEFEGRFFVKINPNGTFINNVSTAFSDLEVPLIEDTTINIDPDNTNVDGTPAGPSVIMWFDALSGVAQDLPTSGSDDFKLAIAAVNYSDVNRDSVYRKYLDKLNSGVPIKFKYANGTLSGDFYYLINTSIFTATYNSVGSATGQVASFQLNRNFDDSQYSGTPSATEVVGIVIYKEKNNTSEVLQSSSNPAIFETEPQELADADLYWEATDAIDVYPPTYPVDPPNVRVFQTLEWFNCYSFGNGVESDRIQDDFNAPMIGKGVRVSSTLEEPYKQETRKAGLIFSGIFNSISGINNLNQFLIAEKITKDLNPIHGGIQKLSSRGAGIKGDLLTLCEDKCFRILANKDALYNADGSINVTANNNVLGQAIPYAGEFGIAKNPESFALYGFRAYFTDKARGAVLRLSMDGLTEISEKGMSDYFQDELSSATGNLIGSYDESTSTYNIKLDSEQVSFKESVDGWTTRLSYTPEFAVSLNNNYYSYDNGELYIHTNTTRANFFGVQESTTVSTIINDTPSRIKNFKTISYEGDAGWDATITTDQQSGFIKTGARGEWKKKEGIYYGWVRGNKKATTAVTPEEFNVVGIGTLAAITGGPSSYTVRFDYKINVSVGIGDTIYFLTNSTGANQLFGTVTSISGDRLTMVVSLTGPLPPVASNPDYLFAAKDAEIGTSGLIGYYAQIDLSTAGTGRNELFAIGSETFISS
jgi:hypothetical protein